MMNGVYALDTKISKLPEVANSPAFSGERLALAGQMILIGLGMVFVVLAVLWAVLTMFKLIFARPEKKKTEPSVQAIVSEPEPIVVAEQSDDELVAIITAAVAAYIENEEPGLHSPYIALCFQKEGSYEHLDSTLHSIGNHQVHSHYFLHLDTSFPTNMLVTLELMHYMCATN